MIDLEGVGVRFAGAESFAVRGVTLTVAAGEMLALVGGSGSGKTTLLKTINRLVDPTEGAVRVGGQNVAELEPVALRRTIGYVIQNVGLFPHWTVLENVGCVPRLLGWPPQRREARGIELLTLVGLPAEIYGHRRPSELSGGQRQRVGFARALAGQPGVLLLDEPFGALDPITRAELTAEFDTLRRRLALTAVMVSHDIAEALVLADRVAVMREGQLLALGTPGELLDPAWPGAASPYVGELLSAPRRQARQIQNISEGRRP